MATMTMAKMTNGTENPRAAKAKGKPARRLADSWPMWTDCRWTVVPVASEPARKPIDHTKFKALRLAEIDGRVRMTDLDRSERLITARQHREIRAGLMRERRIIEAIPDSF